MEDPLISDSEAVPQAVRIQRTDHPVDRISLWILRQVIPVAIVYYVVPFLVEGYIYETRLRGFVEEVRALRHIVESKIDEDFKERVETRLKEATEFFDRTLKQIESKYSDRSNEDKASWIARQPVPFVLSPPATRQVPEKPNPIRSSLVQLENADGEDIVWAGKRWIGTPYSWGGTRMWDGTDCSGFVQALYQSFGVELPRTAREQFDIGLYAPRSYLRPGDLVFFSTIRPGPSHVGIYAGDGKFIHASSGTGWVTVNSLHEPYFRKRYLGARRIIA